MIVNTITTWRENTAYLAALNSLRTLLMQLCLAGDIVEQIRITHRGPTVLLGSQPRLPMSPTTTEHIGTKQYTVYRGPTYTVAWPATTTEGITHE